MLREGSAQVPGDHELLKNPFWSVPRAKQKWRMGNTVVGLACHTPKFSWLGRAAGISVRLCPLGEERV